MALSIRGLVEVRRCPHGRGLFASRDFPKGAVIREFADLVLTSHRTSTPRGRYALQIGENQYWDGFPRGSADYWSNFIDHSDDPNAHFTFDKGRTKAWFRASKPIVKGDEIFIRYDRYHKTNPRF